MIALLLVVALNHCPPPEIIDYGKKLNKNDLHVFRSAQKRCGVKFKRSPCLKRFYVRGNNTYWAVCGKSELDLRLP